jgi:hypothetical protein
VVNPASFPQQSCIATVIDWTGAVGHCTPPGVALRGKTEYNRKQTAIVTANKFLNRTP